ETPLILEALLVGTLDALEPFFSAGMVLDSEKGGPLLERARRAVDLWLRVCPGRADQVQGLVWRGRIHAFASAQPQAVADFRKALELDPDHFDARLHLAQAVAQKAPAEAARHFQILRERDPTNNQVRFSLATIRRGLGQIEEARQVLDEMLADDPDNVS